MTPRRERCLNLVCSQVPTNPEILDILAELIYFCDLLLKNVLIHMNGLLMGPGGGESVRVNRT